MAKNQPFAGRLKEARLRKSARMRSEGQGRYSQERLGIDAGIAEETASARMNQYEKGVHLPELGMAVRFAELLDVPLAYLFCAEDDLAKLLLLAHHLSPQDRAALIEQASKTSSVKWFSDEKGYGFISREPTIISPYSVPKPTPPYVKKKRTVKSKSKAHE